MTIISSIFLQAQLSFAAYGNYVSGLPPTIAALKATGMSDSQATDFATKWTVVDQFPSLTGASATVFQEISTGKRYLAIAGTDFTSIPDLLADYVLSNAFPSNLNPQFIALKGQIDAWIANGTLPATFTVTGHSLGGYLADAVALQYGNRVSSTFTYNAPGVDGMASSIVDALRSALGITGTGTLANLTNIRSTSGWSAIAGLGNQLAPPTLVETETNLINFPANHSIVGLTDSLALCNLLSTLDPSLTIERISSLMKASGNTAVNEQENTLDSLRLLLGKTDVTPTDNRDVFYTNLIALMAPGAQGNAAFQALAGNVQIVSLADRAAASLAADAESEFASFIALKLGLPFVLRDTTGGQASQLYQTNFGDDYAAWRDDALHPEKRELGTVNFSDRWIADRAKLLQAQLTANVQDFDYRHNVNALFVQSNDGKPVDFIVHAAAAADNYVLQTLPADLASQLRGAKYLIGFGSEDDDQGANALTGGGGNDHFYGGSGADQIDGGQGDDYLEGNAGNDTLLGGPGKDVLLGGADDDILAGGIDNDTLKGGAGNDTYVFHDGDGIDTFIDGEGNDYLEGNAFAFRLSGRIGNSFQCERLQ